MKGNVWQGNAKQDLVYGKQDARLWKAKRPWHGKITNLQKYGNLDCEATWNLIKYGCKCN